MQKQLGMIILKRMRIMGIILATNENNIIPIRELIIPIIPIRFRIANTNRTKLFFISRWTQLSYSSFARCLKNNEFYALGSAALLAKNLTN